MTNFIKMATSTSLLLTSLSACKKEETKAAPPIETARAEVAKVETEPMAADVSGDENPDHLRLAESKITFTVGDVSKTLTIAADGTIMAEDKEVAALSANGDMRVDGEVVSTMSRDGSLRFTATGKTMTISAAGEVTDEGKVMMLWNDDGTLGGEALKGMPGMTASYKGTPEHRRAASYAFLAGMLILGKEASDTTTIEAGPGPTKAPEKKPSR